MTDDEVVRTKEELRVALDALVTAAYQNGIEVDDGAYSLRHDDPDVPDWDVIITKTTKPSSGE